MPNKIAQLTYQIICKVTIGKIEILTQRIYLYIERFFLIDILIMLFKETLKPNVEIDFGVMTWI